MRSPAHLGALPESPGTRRGETPGAEGAARSGTAWEGETILNSYFFKQLTASFPTGPIRPRNRVGIQEGLSPQAGERPVIGQR